MAIDEFTMKVPTEMEPLERPPSPPTLKPHEMTVSYLGPHMPSLRLQGRWLERAGFPVGTRGLRQSVRWLPWLLPGQGISDRTGETINQLFPEDSASGS